MDDELGVSPGTSTEGVGVNFYLKDEDFEEPPEDIYYLLAANGLFKVTKTLAFTASTVFFTPRKGRKLGVLDSHEENLELQLPKKVPYKIFLESLGFFREIYRRHKTEAEALLYWDENNKEYVLAVKDQKTERWDLVAEVGRNPEGLIRIGTLHSHGDLWAFHSGIDDEDEEYDDGLHITFGEVMQIPSVSCSVVVGGKRFMMKTSDIFELKKLAAPQVPEEWIKKVKPMWGV